MYPRRPIIVSGPADTVYRRSGFWLIDGNIFPKSAGKGGFLLGTPTEPSQIDLATDVQARQLLDLDGRLQAMDQMGVATQVIYPTLFLAYLTDDVKLEIALCRSYNRFMAGVWEKGQGRLRWVVVPPYGRSTPPSKRSTSPKRMGLLDSSSGASSATAPWTTPTFPLYIKRRGAWICPSACTRCRLPGVHSHF
jgi:hypothetical protein